MLTGPAAFELRHLHGSGSHLQILIFVSREFGGSALRNRPSLAAGSGGRWRGSPSAMRCPLWRQGKRSGQRPQNGGPDRFEGHTPMPHPNQQSEQWRISGVSDPRMLPIPVSSLERPGQCPPGPGRFFKLDSPVAQA